MAPKKTKTTRADQQHEAANESKNIHKDQPESVPRVKSPVIGQPIEQSQPAPVISRLPPPEIPPPEIPPPQSLSTHVHKNVNVHFDGVPTVIPLHVQPDYGPEEPEIRPIDQHDRSLFYSDQKPHIDMEKKNLTTVIPKRAYRTEEINKNLDKVRGMYVADFALTQDALNAQISTESLAFEEPILSGYEKGDQSNRERLVGATDPIILAVEEERLSDLIEAKYELDLYPPLDEAVPEAFQKNETQPRLEQINGRPDMMVFFEQFPFPDPLVDASSMLQISIAKRKKKLQLEAPSLNPPRSPSYATIAPFAVVDKPIGIVTGKSSHDRSSKHKKNTSPGHGTQKPHESLPHDPPEEKDKHHPNKAPGKEKTKPEIIVTSNEKSNLHLISVKASDFGDVTQGSKLDLTLQTGPTRTVPSGLPQPVVGYDLSGSASQSPDMVDRPPTVGLKPKIRTESWESFFGPVSEEEHFVDITEVGTGFESVRGPTGLRKQFVEDEKGSVFFRQLLDQLVTKWVRQATSSSKAPTTEGKHQSVSGKDAQSGPAYQPTLENILPIVRKVRDPNSGSSVLQAAFAGSSDAFTEKIERLQRMNFPRYDRGPQQTLLPTPGMAYDKMNCSVGILQRHWFHSPAKSIMETYESQLYPHFEKSTKPLTTEVPVLRFYGPTTSAKDMQYDPANFTGVSGTSADEKYTSSRRLEQCNSQHLTTVLRKEVRQQSKTRKYESRHLPVTPRPAARRSHVTFSEHRKPLSKPKSKPNPYGKVSINVVRRLNATQWPDRLLPEPRKGAKASRYLEDTENWSVYVATQAKLLAAVKKNAAKEARKLRGFNPKEECYCRQPRVDRREKYIPRRKPRKHRVQLRLSRIFSNRSFPGIRCVRVQKATIQPPRYQQANGRLPDQLVKHKTRNPLWNGLQDYWYGRIARNLEKMKQAEPEAANAALPLPVRAEDTSRTGLRTASSALLVDTDKSVAASKKLKLGVKKSRIDQEKQTVEAVTEDGAIQVPLKAPLTTLKGLVAQHLKIAKDGSAETRANRAPSVENRPDHPGSFNSAVSGFLGSTGRGRRSPGLLAKSPERATKNASNWETDSNPPGLETFTFAQIPPDFRWSLLNCNTTLDRLAEDAVEVEVRDTQEVAPMPQKNEPPSLSDLKTSSLNFIDCTNKLVTERGSGHSLELVRKLADKEIREAGERRKRAYSPPALPAYMAGKNEKRVRKTPIEKKRQTEVPEKNRNPEEPVSNLQNLFGQAELRVQQGRKLDVPLTNIAKLSTMFEQPLIQSQHSSRPPVIQNRSTVLGTSLTGLKTEEGRLAHPRLQRSLIFRKRSTKASRGSSSVGTAVKEPIGSFETSRQAGGEKNTQEGKSGAEPRKKISKFVGKGSMYISTVKTQPRNPLARVPPHTKNKCNTAFFLDQEKAACLAITRQVESFSKLKSYQNIKSYAAQQTTRKKYAETTDTSQQKDTFILNDNFWRKRPPFVVAIKSILGRNILPNLRHYLRNSHSRFSSKTNLSKDFKLDGDIGLTFRVRNQEDAELEFQLKDVNERPLNIVQRCLRKRLVDRLSNFLPSTENLDCVVNQQKLRLFEPETIKVKRDRLFAEWLRNRSNSEAAELLYKLPRQRAVWAFILRSRSRRHTERLIRRYTGEYHYQHLARAILKSKLKVPSTEKKIPEPDPEPAVTEREKSAENLETERLTAQKVKKSPTSGKASKKLFSSDGESESGATLEDHREAGGTPSGGLSTGAKRESAAPRNATAAGPRDKTKALQKEFFQPVEPSYKAPVESVSMKLPGVDKHVLDQSDDKKSDAVLAYQATGSASDNLEEPWWVFRPADYFSSSSKKIPAESGVKGLFASQMAFADNADNPVELLEEPSSLSFQEQSLLGLVEHLKLKLASDPKFRQVFSSTSPNGGATAPSEKSAERPRPDSRVIATEPAAIKTSVRRLQDLASGGPHKVHADTDSPDASPLTGTQLHQSLLELHKEHNPDHQQLQQPSDHLTYLLSRNRHSDRWLTSLDGVSTDTVRTSCNVNLGRTSYAWQLPEILQLKRKVKIRCQYYDACIAYLRSLIPLTGSEATAIKLQQLSFTQDASEQDAPMSISCRKERMAVLAHRIEDLGATACQSETDSFRNRLTALILQLALAKLHLEYHTDRLIQNRQRRNNEKAVASWYRSLHGGASHWTNPCYVMADRKFQRTPPHSPPRNQSPMKAKADTITEAPNDEDGTLREKKGKSDKNGDKGKGLKKSKDGVKDDKKPPRLASENTAKRLAK